MTQTQLERIIERAKTLCDWSKRDLRQYLAGFGCDEPPTAGDIKCASGNKTKGELIEAILYEEFTLPEA